MNHYTDKSGTRTGEYVIYCRGAQRVKRDGNGWRTYALGSASGVFIPAYGRTLRELANKVMARNQEMGD